MKTPEYPWLIGADFGRSDAQTAEVFYYTPAAADVEVRVIAPRGWQLVQHEPLHAVTNQVRIGKATLVGTDEPIEIGSPVQIVVVGMGEKIGASEPVLKIEITSDALTVWSLAGPIAVNAQDALATLPELEAQYAPDEKSDATWRLHRGLQCSAYVNLTAFLENIYGPIPSGDYKVYKRIAYASSFVHSPIACKANLHLVGEDRFVVLCNGIEVFRTARSNEPIHAEVSLQRGWNRLFIKSSQDATREWGGRRWGFELRLLNSNGDRMAGLLTSSRAPSAQLDSHDVPAR